MSNGRVREINDPRAWNEFLCAHGGHLLQTYEWGELKTEFGWRAQRLGIETNGELVAGAQLLIRRAPWFTFAYVPRGPTIRANDTDSAHELMRALRDAAREQDAMLLKLEPNTSTLNSSLARLPALGFVPSRETIQPRTSIHLDLTPDLDTLLAQMKPKWRYNIRLASKKGVLVREARADELAPIYELVRITGARDKFAVHSFAYYQRVAGLLADNARWFIATFDGEIVAAIFVTAFAREAIYLYGASGHAHRDKMPNHALHWHALQWAKARGCTHYDWWGIPDDANATGEKLPEGLARFKEGFGGAVVRYVGAYDHILRPFPHRLYKLLRQVKRDW